MRISRVSFALAFVLEIPSACGGESPSPFAADPAQALERTCFQTGQAWSGTGNLRSDVAIVYGIDPGLPPRIESWREHGYRIHVMTGVSWGHYQDYLYGRFDGTNHVDEAQTDSHGKKISHGGDVYYMSPGTNYGKFLCVGVQRALDAGAEAIHLEEPEFWVRAGYSEGFKREWRGYYGEEWQPPESSVDAQWRASKLKYFLYRRALQQVFAYVQAYNRGTGRDVHCYVPTHSLLNYAQWRIVSPESSLARLDGCDGYIAQVWTGTSRTPNLYRGQLRERTFETAFLEYGAMQNLVRATGRTVWYLNDPVEDNPNHDWNDYRQNWESTLVASLLQPEVWRYEVAPWPERVFGGRYPRQAGVEARQTIPGHYATELEIVMNALNDMHQEQTQWDCGSQGVGVLVSDSLMFERGEPAPSDAHLSDVYGLALPLLKRGLPVTPVQLENVTVPHYLNPFHLLLLTYHGMKPLTAEVHTALADWVRQGNALLVVDDDTDPSNAVREWWNSSPHAYRTPRQHLFEQLGVNDSSFTAPNNTVKVGSGTVTWLHANPASLAQSTTGDVELTTAARAAADTVGLAWKETSYLLLRRGPYLLGAGLDESVPGPAKVVQGRFVNLFDSELRVQSEIPLTPGARVFLLDLQAAKAAQVLASACKVLPLEQTPGRASFTVEGVADTPAVVLLRVPALGQRNGPPSVILASQAVSDTTYSAEDHLLWVRFSNTSTPRRLEIEF